MCREPSEQIAAIFVGGSLHMPKCSTCVSFQGCTHLEFITKVCIHRWLHLSSESHNHASEEFLCCLGLIGILIFRSEFKMGISKHIYGHLITHIPE